MHWKKVTLVGVGLLGGSLGLALKQRRLADAVVGFVRREGSVAECEARGAVDQATRDLSAAVDQAELIVLCTPIGQMRALVERMLPGLKRGAIVTDVGSVKAGIVHDLEALTAKTAVHFVGSHPMAGAERMGVAAARSDLFERSICVVTATVRSNRPAVRKLEGFWKSVGARLLKMAPEQHDKLVSRSSHLPHVIAAELANFVLGAGSSKEQGMLCANGFRDTTRIASGSPEMWRDIALANRENLAHSLDVVMRDLGAFRRALARRDDAAISKFFEKAKTRRDEWSSETGSSSPE